MKFKFAKFYLLITFSAIAVLAATSFWQYKQFLNNYKKITTLLPQNINETTVDAGSFDQKINDLLSQARVPSEATKTTKEFEFEDENISFNYGSNWQKLNLEAMQNESDPNETLVFAAYKTITATNPTPSYLTVKKTIFKTADEAIAKYKSDAGINKLPTDFTQSEFMTNSGNSIIILESRYKATIPTATQTIDLPIKTAIVAGGNNYYLISCAGADNNSENNSIFKSIKLRPLP